MSTPTMAMDNDGKMMMLGGVRVNHGKVSVTYGVGTPVGGPVMLVESVDAGQTGNWSNDFVAAFPVWKSLYLGVLGGPEVDWGTRVEGDDSPVAYLVGAVGGVAAYDFGIAGIAGFYKYRNDLQDDTFYEDGHEFGLGLFMWL